MIVCLFLLQNDFESNVDAFASTIKSLYLNETKALKQKVQQQNAEIKKLQLTCSDHATNIQQLKEIVSTLQKSNEDLKAQLQDKETFLENLNSAIDLKSEVLIEEESFESCEEKITYDKRISSLSYSFSHSPAPKMHQKRSNSELPNKVV